MDYALLPFPTFARLAPTEGRPDIRAALAARPRKASATTIGNTDLLDEVVDALRSLPWQFCIDHCHETSGDLHLAVLARDLGRNLDLNDKLNAGFYLQNSESGRFETLACTRVFRVACANGALLECEAGQSFSVTTADAPPNNWRETMRAVIERSFAGDGLDVDTARFRATTEQMLVTPYELLLHLAAQGLIDEDEQSDIQAAFSDAADFTTYGLINAVTQVAHRLRSDDRWTRAFQIERLGGEILRGDHNLPCYEPAYSR